MLAAAGKRLILAIQTVGVVSIFCIVASAHNLQAQDDNARGELVGGQQKLASLVSYLAPNETYSKLVQQSSSQAQADIERKILSLLDLVGPDMKPANGFGDPQNITLDVAQRAWQLMHEHASQFASERVGSMWPIVKQALVEANVQDKCLEAADKVAVSAARLETWAVKCEYKSYETSDVAIWANNNKETSRMLITEFNFNSNSSLVLNSWGTFPPVGLFEGTLGDIGSFHGCLSVPENDAIEHAHYCTFSFRPILPTRKDYELIISQEPKALLELFNGSDAFNALASKSQYNHYVYYKLGTCLPISCTPLDAQKIAGLLAKRAILMSGPVKCHSKFQQDYNDAAQTGRALKISSQDLNNGVYIWKPHVTTTQSIALVLLGLIGGVILIATVLDLFLNRWRVSEILVPFGSVMQAGNASTQQAVGSSGSANGELGPLKGDSEAVELNTTGKKMALNHGQMVQVEQDSNNNNQVEGGQLKARTKATRPLNKLPLLRRLANELSLITNTSEFFVINKRGDILCMNGLRCITMSWIILAHTIQYNDWSAFGRIYEVETHLRSWLNQPIFNASYLVDTFFIMSGLLASYSVFRVKRADSPPFSARTYLIGRYLRLTPQILLVSLLFILLPLSTTSDGPHWDSMTGEYSENCANHWWVNLLHIQAFYKPDEMCNFVCWWVSVDMLYHVVATGIVVAVIRFGRRLVLTLCSILIVINALIQAGRHYQMGLPPNLLSTIPQTGAMWTKMTLSYFWTPNAHLFPFLFGFSIGLLLARNKQKLANWFTPVRAFIGWCAAIVLFGLVSFGTHFWVIGQWRYSSEVSTLWALFAQIIWTISVCWTIVACQMGHGGFIDQILSCKLFIVLGKASYLVYLSHFLILFTFFGSQNLLLEPTRIMIIYIILGNVCLSTGFGTLLCVAFEMPWLKLQRRIMKRLERRFN